MQGEGLPEACVHLCADISILKRAEMASWGMLPTASIPSSWVLITEQQNTQGFAGVPLQMDTVFGASWVGQTNKLTVIGQHSGRLLGLPAGYSKCLGEPRRELTMLLVLAHQVAPSASPDHGHDTELGLLYVDQCFSSRQQFFSALQVALS